MLKAELLSDGWTVIDTDGGRWWPDNDAEKEILEADDPAAKAVEICDIDPSRGEWLS
jgi:hypothetical protein